MKTFSKIVLFAVITGSLSAYADLKAFTKAEYDTALKAGRTVVVDFHADWCPTCRKQEPLINEIVKSKGYENIVALKANYDDETDLKRSLNVSKQSTVVVFKNGKEVGRNTGATNKEELKKLIDLGL